MAGRAGLTAGPDAAHFPDANQCAGRRIAGLLPKPDDGILSGWILPHGPRGPRIAHGVRPGDRGVSGFLGPAGE